MKVKKFSKEWFMNKKKQYENMMPGYNKIKNKDGVVVAEQNKKDQRLQSLKELAKEKGIKYE